MITNCPETARISRLEGHHELIFQASDRKAAYSHHPQITSLNGTLFVTWSIGHFHEDGPGQRMVISRSEDRGLTWSPPETLMAVTSGEHRPPCITSGGLYVWEGGITAYYSSYEFTLEGALSFAETGVEARGSSTVPHLQEVHTGVLTSTDGGTTWEHSGVRIPGFITNLSPVQLANGRLILTSNRMHAWSDDPAGIHGWTISPLPGLPVDYYEGAGGDHPIQASWRHLGICEGAVYEVPGKPVRLLSRTSKGFLALAESPDCGATWTAPSPTGFTDCGSRMQFGRLPDGRYFALNCPDPAQPESGLRRTPLVLALSEDGDVFDRHYIIGDEPDRPPRFPGAYKHGRYGYPYAHCMDGQLYIVNSVGKEDIECHVFNLDALD